MKDINNINIQQENLNLIIEEINKNIYNGELTEIFEITYAYDNGFNLTLFKEFLGYEYEKIFKNKNYIDLDKKNEILKQIFDKTQKKLQSKKKTILKYINKINSLAIKSRENEIIKDLLLGALNYGLDIIDITLTGLIFEIEKAGYNNNLSQDEKKLKKQKIINLENNIFGGEIKNNPEEVILVYEYLKNNYENKKLKFTEEENKKYLIFLNKAGKYLPNNYKYKKINNNSKIIENDFLNKNIPRDKYVKILQNVFDLLNLDLKVKVEERGSIYDGEHHLGIPKSDRYKYLTIKRILQLISHEIEAHTINLKNNKKLIGYFRSAANLEKEEGLAIVMEKLLNGQNLEEIGIPQHFPKVFMGEILNGEELKEFLKLDNIINPDISHKGRFFRLKRNYPLDLPGVQHKDTSYGRGTLKIVKILKDIKLGKSDIDIRDLFLGKVGFNDIKKAKELMKIKRLKYNDLHMPLFIGELIKYLFEIEDNNFNSRRKKNISQDDFLKYLKKKYNFINFNNIEIKTLSFIEKMKIGRILKEIKKVF